MENRYKIRFPTQVEKSIDPAWIQPGSRLDPGQNFDFFLIFQKCPKNASQGPRGPWGAWGHYFPLFSPIFGPQDPSQWIPEQILFQIGGLRPQIEQFGHGSRPDPAWIQAGSFWIQHGSSLDPAWIQPALGPGPWALGPGWAAGGGGGRVGRMRARKSEPAAFPTFPPYFPRPKSLPCAAEGLV